MKWRLSLLLLTLLILPTLLVLPSHGAVSFGYGGGANYFTYSLPIVIQSSSIKAIPQTEAGSTLQNEPWSNSIYVQVVNNSELQVLFDDNYINNNASVSLNVADIALNVTLEVNYSTNTNPSYGGVEIGYGTYFPAQSINGNYGPSLPNDFLNNCAGIVVVLEHGAMKDYQIFVYYNGANTANWSVGNIKVGQKITLGFSYVPPDTVYIYWDNGTLYKYITNPPIAGEKLNTINKDFTIGFDNGGPVFGFGQWVIVSYQYALAQPQPAYTANIMWTAVTMSNGVKALYAFTDADNPVNVSTNATSWSFIGIEKVQNFSVTGTVYSVQGQVSYSVSSNGIYLITNVYPSGDLDGWYLNVTLEFQFVTPEQTVYKNITIPVFIDGFAEHVSVCPPGSSYLSGQTINVTSTTTPNFPPNLGYKVISPPVAEINIQGLTDGFVPLPYVITTTVSTITSYNYIISITEGGFVLGSLTGTITIYPVSQLPVIFVSQYPSTVTAGTKITLTFQFSLNTPVANVTESAFVQRTNTFAFAYASLVSSKSLIEFKASWYSSDDGFIIITKSANYLLPFNGSSGLKFFYNNVNTLQIEVNNGQLVISNNYNQVVTINNNTPVIGVGFYYGAGPLDLDWFFVDGIILQSSTANQAYTILTGTSVSSLMQYVSGYTNASGFGQVNVTLTDTPYELVEIYWAGMQKYIILNISVTPSQQSTTSSSTAPNVTTPSYNYNQPFSNSIAPNSTLYNFSNAQPWATIIGIAVVVVVALLGWKFGDKAGASGGAVAGLIAVSYLGLMPWFIFYIFIFGVALLLAKTFVDRFMGGEE
jgi:hypothetical protein